MLNLADRKEVLFYFQLQGDLVEAFFKKFPDVKDMEWLLDFPKNGSIQMNGEIWNFTKHGKGIRFFTNNTKSNKIVDVNTHINSPELVDVWRLSQYLSSNNENNIQNLLNDMVDDGQIEVISNRFYKIKT